MAEEYNQIPYNRDITYFAKTNFRSANDIFGIKRKDRRQHMYVLGKSGTGKSVLLSNLIVQNIQNGEGVCVVDPHGELVEEILHLIPEHRAKDVIYFNPADPDFHIGFNVMQLEDPKYKHLVASGLMGIFTKIWANAWSSRMEYILNNAILALLDTPNTTMLGIPRMLVDKDYRQMIINNLKDPVVKAFWVHEYEQWRDQFRNEAIAPIQNKVGQFLSTSIIRNVVGQQKSTIDIFKIMNEGKIFLVNVSKGRIGEDNSALLGGMIITKLQLAAMERVRIPEEERKDFYLYVDEFQNFATNSFANILSEARKYRLNLIIAHQYTAQLETKDGTSVRDAVFGNVGTMIIFRVGADDADFLEKEFEPEFTAQDLVNLPNYHVYLKLMIDGITSRPFSASTLPPIKVDISKGIKGKIIELSRSLYTRSRSIVEDEISKWSGMLQTSEGESKYKSDCSNCTKSVMVPFEPKEGRPVYCRDCMAKIKNGELQPAKGFVVSKNNNKDSNLQTDSLAALGIEFKSNGHEENIHTGDHFKAQNKNFNKDNKFHKDNNFNKDNKFHKDNNFNKDNKFNKDKNHKEPFNKKHSGPSPLLKGLLQRIGLENNKENDNTSKVDVEEIKPVVKQEPISLSKLKENHNNNFKDKKDPEKTHIPSKEASDEKKASLKDILAKIESSKISHSNNIKEDQQKKEIVEVKKEEPIIENIVDKKEEFIVPVPPEVVVEIPKIIEIPNVPEIIETPKIKEDPKHFEERIEKKMEENKIDFSEEDKNTKNNDDTQALWKKKKAKNEVPEDVLRKVLEE